MVCHRSLVLSSRGEKDERLRGILRRFARLQRATPSLMDRSELHLYEAYNSAIFCSATDCRDLKPLLCLFYDSSGEAKAEGVWGGARRGFL